MMLRSGIGYRQFAELAKLAFVQEAIGEKDRRGRRTNLSRVAIRTGLSRKEVSRLQSQIAGPAQQSGAARSISTVFMLLVSFSCGIPIPDSLIATARL
jgi:hypothetical protein